MIDYKITDGQLDNQNFDVLFVDGDDATIQRIRQKYLLWQGEWFLDTNAGVPWLQILGQKPDPQLLTTLLRTVVADDPGISEIESFEFEYEGSTRKLKIIWQALSISGAVISDEVVVP